MFDNMTWIGVVGIMDPLREGVATAVRDCQNAGVVVRMVTGDNVNTARAIAVQCGIFSGGMVMEGPVFRSLSSTERSKIIPGLQVLARSSPEDKYILVKCLKALGETVAVTGDGTNDGPALRIADVGISMGITGTEVTKEASDIILMDDNFSSIVKAILWGRCIGDAVKKFLQVSSLIPWLIQFQLTVNVSAVVLAFVSAIASDQEQSVLTPVQLLWVNLIQDTFSALALATDPPNLTLLHRKPDSRDASIINFDMWKMIIGQSILQLVITFVLAFAGLRIFTSWSALEVNSVVFNTYVWLQISNQFNCRRIDNHLNVFSGVHRNTLFLLITCITVCGQIVIIFVGGTAFSVTRLNGVQWAVSIVLGLLSLPFGALVRIIPNMFIKRFIPGRFTKSSNARTRKKKTVTMWDPDDPVEDKLTFIKRVRSHRRLGVIGRPIRRQPGDSEIEGTELSSRRSFNEASQMENQFVCPLLG
jgi:P-type Ca2+ transporter type 2C